MLLNIDELKEGVLQANRAMLARAITLVESKAELHRQLASDLITSILPYTGKSLRIGITGSPGVGKSTFIDSFGDYLTQQGHKIAVLAIDPTSKVSGGSILGDKTRMEKLVGNENAFVRPSPAGNELGGVAQKTYESILLCEAAGYDIILVETVGVGQSETAVKEMTDLLLFITIAGAGDELQGIKRGIMEMVDIVLINKADQIEPIIINTLKSNLDYALHLFPEKSSNFNVPVLTCSALNGLGFENIFKQIFDYKALVTNNGYFETNRNNQKVSWLKRSLENLIFDHIYTNPQLKIAFESFEKQILENKISSITAANKIFELFKSI